MDIDLKTFQVSCLDLELLEGLSKPAILLFLKICKQSCEFEFNYTYIYIESDLIKNSLIELWTKGLIAGDILKGSSPEETEAAGFPVCDALTMDQAQVRPSRFAFLDQQKD